MPITNPLDLAAITHAFVSAKSAAGDSTLVDGPKWNAAHDGANGFYAGFLSADLNLTTTSIVASPNLGTFPIAASEDWLIQAYLYVNMTSLASQGLNVQITGPASPANVRGALHSPNTTGTTTARTAVTAFATSYGPVTGANTLAGVLYELYCTIENGANAGNIGLSFGLKLSGTGAILRGSSLLATRVG